MLFLSSIRFDGVANENEKSTYPYDWSPSEEVLATLSIHVDSRVDCRSE